MSHWKPDRGEWGKRSSAPVPVIRKSARGGERHGQAWNGFRNFAFRIMEFATPKFVALCAVAFVCLGLEMSRAQVSDAEKASYANALAYCRGDVPRPMALRSDKRVLCLDGWDYSEQDISLANSLEQGGHFVVRSGAGDIATTIALANIIGDKHATTVVNDYCLSTCANYFLIASAETIVPEGALVAWTHVTSGSNICFGLADAPDHGPLRLELAPCTDPVFEARGKNLELMLLKDKFYKERTLDQFVEPPESFTIRRILRRKFEAAGGYPYVFWTWNPRYYASAIKAKVLYEAYPQSQDEVDAIVSRIHLGYSVIYDP